MQRIVIMFFLAFVAIVFSSCKDNYHQNEKELLFFDFHSRKIPIDSVNNLGEMLEYFDKIYCREGEQKWPVLYLDIEKQAFVSEETGRNLLKIGVEPSPCPGLTLEYDFKCLLEIVKDGNNIELEGERIEMDSISNYVRKHYNNIEKDTLFPLSAEQNGIWICALKKEKLSDLAPIVTVVVKSYLQSVNEVSKQVYKKELKDINKSQLLELKKRMPFRIAFKYTDEVVPVLQVG